MVRLSYFLSLALAAQGLHAAPTAQGLMETRDVVLPRQRNSPAQQGQSSPVPAGGKAAADAQADKISKTPDPFPNPQTEGQRQGNRGSTKFDPSLANLGPEPAGGKEASEKEADRISKTPDPFPNPNTEAQRQGQRGGTKFKDTPEGQAAAAAADKAKSPSAEPAGGKEASEKEADRISKTPDPFPNPKTEAQRQGDRGSTKFKDTPQGAAAAAAAAGRGGRQ